MKRNLETKKEREGRRENKSCCNKSLESWIRGHGEHILQRSQPKTQHIPPSYCVCVRVCVHQKHLAGMNGRGPCALTAVLGSTSLFFFFFPMTWPQKGLAAIPISLLLDLRVLIVKQE